MKITIIYDNTAFAKNLYADWGFSCLVEAYEKKILFDTGAKGSILLDNMKRLGIDFAQVDMVFISHDHWDHTGGLSSFLRKNPVKVYIPDSCRITGENIHKIKSEPFKISEHIYSTGTLQNIEHSLVITDNGKADVITGCSHPGVSEIIEAASKLGKVNNLIGGLHGFNDFELINDLKNICPTHCTQFIRKIKEAYPDKYIEGGAGKVIEIA